MQDLKEWIREQVITSVIIRLDLKRTMPGINGSERVQAQILGRHWDEDGPVWGRFFFDANEGSDDYQLELYAEEDEADWLATLDILLEGWSERNWCQLTPNLVRFGRERQRYNGREQEKFTDWSQLPTEHYLVTQHLARIQGVMSERARNGTLTVDERGLLHTTITRIGGVIRNSNNHTSSLLGRP